MEQFFERLVKTKPDMIGSVIYFSPTKKADLACVVQADGTVSPVPLRFSSTRDLCEAWKKGEILGENGSKLPTRVIVSKTSSMDFFFNPGRQDSVYNYFRRNKESLNPTVSEDITIGDEAEDSSTTTTVAVTEEPDQTVDMSDSGSNVALVPIDGPAILLPRISTPVMDAAKAMVDFSMAAVLKNCPISDDFEENSAVIDSSVERGDEAMDTFPFDHGSSDDVASSECHFIESSPSQPLMNVFSAAVVENSVSSANVPFDAMASPVFGDLTTASFPVHGTVATSSLSFKNCPGFARSPHQAVISKRQWDSNRMEFSPVVFNGDRCWSKECVGAVRGDLSLCWYCKATRKRLWDAKPCLKSNTDDTTRIMKTNNRWLTAEEKLKKTIIVLQRTLQKKNQEIRKKNQEIRSLKTEVRRYRPAPENRVAIKSIQQLLEREQRKVEAPICQWLLDGNEVCGHRATSIVLLKRHIREAHFKPQLESNKERSPADKEYWCEWKGCKRQVSFSKFELFRRHIITHSGDAQTENRLLVLREEMVNSSRAPTGRRYSEITKQTMLKNYQNRGEWNRNRNMDILGGSRPSLRSMLAWKNHGGVKSGIDWTILQSMEKIGKAAPNVKHGILTFDEIYVNPRKLLAQNGTGEFGMADNVDGELARTVLVFQYIALFSRKRFAISVAWYGCGIKTGLNAEQLETWLFEVMLGLQRYGFRVHAIVCDGLETNRCLQRKLVSDALDAGLEDCHDYAIPHPLSTQPDLRLFFFFDPSHLIKLIRNRLFNRKTLAFTSDSPSSLFEHLNMRPDIIRWSDFEKVRDWQWQYPRVERRLTRKHLELDNFSKMTVQYAIDIMSEPIEEVLLEIDALGTSSTRYFMRAGRDLWLAMNDHDVYFNAGDAKPIVERLERASKTFDSWMNNTVDDPGLFLTDQSYTGACLLCNGIPPFMEYVWKVVGKEVPRIGFTPRTISQDNLERTFGELRQKCGGTQNITVLGLAFNLRTVNENIVNDFKLMLGIRD